LTRPRDHNKAGWASSNFEAPGKGKKICEEEKEDQKLERIEIPGFYIVTGLELRSNLGQSHYKGFG
jgi:hypothetical protein